MVLAGWGSAQAKVVRDTHSGATDAPAVESGGHRLLPRGKTHISCSQFGNELYDLRGATQLGVSSWSLIGGLSFQRRGDTGRTVILPLGDGITTCTVSPDR
jgi:hypothetical protein